MIRGYLTDDALVIGSFGVLDKETTISGAKGQSPFRFWRIEDELHLLQLTENSAVIIVSRYLWAAICIASSSVDGSIVVKSETLENWAHNRTFS